MPAAAETLDRHPPPKSATGAAVWERVWRHVPSPEKDDNMLARELRSPRWRSIVNRLVRTFGHSANLDTIELGAGRGDLSVLLARLGCRVTIVDCSDTALALARERFDRLKLPAQFVTGNILGDLEILAGRFDVSLSSGVIEHFSGDARRRTVRAHHEVLRPGGLAVISVPHAWCVPYRIWKAYLELRGWWPYGMEIPYSRDELSRLARNIGLKQVASECMGFWQSIGDQWGRNLFGLRPDWVDMASVLDRWMGLTLLVYGRRAGPWIGDAEASPCR